MSFYVEEGAHPRAKDWWVDRRVFKTAGDFTFPARIWVFDASADPRDICWVQEQSTERPD